MVMDKSDMGLNLFWPVYIAWISVLIEGQSILA